MIIKIKNPRAETLMEVVIAVALLSFILITTLKIVWNARQSLDSAKNRAQAVSIAREWLEIARYSRDANWITYSNNIRQCWNFHRDNTPDWIINFNDDTCEPWPGGVFPEHPLQWSYIPLQNIDDDTTTRFFLSTLTWADILDDTWNLIWTNGFSIYKDLTLFRLCEDWKWWLIVSCNSPWISEEAKWLKFFRKVKIDYVDIYWEDSWGDISDHMKVTSSVVWPQWSNTQSVELVTILSDYYWRDIWDRQQTSN